MSKGKQNRVDVGAGWKKESDKGPYIALSFKMTEVDGVSLENCWVSLVKNIRKNNEKHPDYIVTASPKADAPQKQKPQQDEDNFGF
jgi:uncharacterized protein (DUF736 family)